MRNADGDESSEILIREFLFANQPAALCYFVIAVFVIYAFLIGSENSQRKHMSDKLVNSAYAHNLE